MMGCQKLTIRKSRKTHSAMHVWKLYLPQITDKSLKFVMIINKFLCVYMFLHNDKRPGGVPFLYKIPGMK